MTFLKEQLPDSEQKIVQGEGLGVGDQGKRGVGGGVTIIAQYPGHIHHISMLPMLVIQVIVTGDSVTEHGTGVCYQ